MRCLLLQTGVPARELKQHMLTVKVLDLEDAGSGLSSSSLKLGRVDLDESILVQVFSEELTNSGLYPEDSLVCGSL